MDEFEALAKSEHRECTAIYTVNLEPGLTVQGNDIGMLPAQGVDTTITPDDPEWENFRPWTEGNPHRTFGENNERQPFRDNPSRQARAEDMNSVTALTEVDATPLGFQRDTLRMYHAVCVHVRGVYSRWVEIMAESLQPDQQICVRDWDRPDLAENVLQETCGNGNLYMCRDSTNNVKSDGTFEDKMSVKFYCQDSCDDPDFEFYWRIVASQEKPMRVRNPDTNREYWQQPDGENWCAHRKGDDFPSSLLKPYPVNYQEPVIFASTESASSTSIPSRFVLVMSVIFALAQVAGNF